MVVPVVVHELNIPSASTTWPASAFALTTGSTILIFGRLIDIHDGRRVYLLGLAWYIIWSAVAGFSTSAIMLDCARALQGFGPAAFLTAGMSLIGSTYSPGPRKNVVFSIYSGSAPAGFFAGILVGGLCGQYLSWRWYFWIGAIMSAVVGVAAVLTIPWATKARVENRPKMDWLGSILFLIGLVLVVFAITVSGHAPQGWRTIYVPVTCVIGVLALIAAVYVEGWVAEDPLLPLHIFSVPQMAPFTIALFLSFGVFGTWLLYATMYMQNLMGAGPLQVVAWFVPFGIGGLVISAVGASVLHRVPGSIFLILSGIAWVIAPLLFALAPNGASYWAWVFPAMICGTLGIDIAYIVSSIFITTSLPEHLQGLAGAVFNSLLFLGISFFLGFADLTASQFEAEKTSKAYRAAFWFATACGALSLAILVIFVRVKPATSMDDKN